MCFVAVGWLGYRFYATFLPFLIMMNDFYFLCFAFTGICNRRSSESRTQPMEQREERPSLLGLSRVVTEEDKVKLVWVMPKYRTNESRVKLAWLCRVQPIFNEVNCDGGRQLVKFLRTSFSILRRYSKIFGRSPFNTWITACNIFHAIIGQFKIIILTCYCYRVKRNLISPSGNECK